MKQKQYLLLLVLFATGLSSGFAQKISSQKGLTTAIFNLPEGNIQVNLPKDIRAGDMITGSINSYATGKNTKQLEKNLSALVKYSVNIDGNKIAVPAKQGSFTWQVQKDRLQMAPLQLVNESGVKTSELPLELNKGVDQPTASKQCAIPSHALTASPLTIKGSFDGDAANTKCSLDNKPVEIIAESPRQCIVQYPADAGGLHNFSLTENGGEKPQQCSRLISSVRMEVAAGKLSLMKGEKTYIHVNIAGLQNLPDTAVLTLSNITPDVVIMQPSNNFLVALTPDSINRGIYDRTFNIQSLKTGTFTVNVNLDLPDSSNTPPFFADVKKLDKPRRLEDKALQIGLHVALKKLEADAGGANGKEYNTACDNCRNCIKSRMGEWAADLIKKLGDIVLDEYLGKVFDAIISSAEKLKQLKEFMDKVDKKIENAKDLSKELEDMIKAGQLQVLVLAPKMCGYCSTHGTIFYNPTTGCVFAVIYCEGTKNCCENVQTIFKITYCTDEYGEPIGMPSVEVIRS